MLDKSKFNILELKTEEIIKKTGRDLDYVGTWDIGYGKPTAVFADRKMKPGAKLFLLITKLDDGSELREDRDWEDFGTHHSVVGTRCEVCSEVIYSPCFQHPGRCKCGMTKIEGGPTRPTIFGPGKTVEINMTSRFRGKGKDET